MLQEARELGRPFLGPKAVAVWGNPSRQKHLSQIAHNEGIPPRRILLQGNYSEKFPLNDKFPGKPDRPARPEVKAEALKEAGWKKMGGEGRR